MENVYLSTLKVELRIRTFASSGKIQYELYTRHKLELVEDTRNQEDRQLQWQVYILGRNWNQQKIQGIKRISNYSGRYTSTSRTSSLLFLISPSISFSALSLTS